MKTYEVTWRQTFETKLRATFEASSEEAAINKAKKYSKQLNASDDLDVECFESFCPDTTGGDDFNVENED